MKKLLIIFGLTITALVIFIQLKSVVSAVTVGVEPPSSFINALKNCTKGTFKDKQHSMITEYNIKGLLPNGRCEFTQTITHDFSDKEDYETAKMMLGGFTDMAKSMAKQSNQKIPNDTPTVDDMIKQIQSEKEVSVCKLSKKERDDLYNAYQKHDGKNPPAQKTADGISFSWDSSKMSSYDHLMMTYAQGPCSSNDEIEYGGEKPKTSKKYACEYADTTCYITIYTFNGGAKSSTMTCTGDRSTFGLIDKVQKHAESGMCSLL